jgi:adenosylhomocysteine nucleosidase
MIGIIAAMEAELRRFKENLRHCQTVTSRRLTFYTGDIEGRAVVLARSGIGKVNVAYTAAVMIEKFSPEIILNSGVAGGLGRTRVMDLVVATAVVQHDFDATALGDPAGLIPEVGLVRIPTDERATKALLAAIDGAKSGVIATGDQFISSETRRADIVKTFDAVACEMEGGAIGQVCYLTDTPFAVVRVISDGGDENGAGDYRNFMETAAFKTADAVTAAIRHLA